MVYKMNGFSGFGNSPINKNDNELESPSLSPDKERLLLKMEKDMARQRNITVEEAGEMVADKKKEAKELITKTATGGVG